MAAFPGVERSLRITAFAGSHGGARPLPWGPRGVQEAAGNPDVHYGPLVMPTSPELLALYQQFDRLMDLPVDDQQAELESLRTSGDPLALQLEGMLIYHRYQNPTETLFSVDELMSVVDAELPWQIASDLRELSRRLHWDPRSRCFRLGHFSLFQCLSVSAIGATYHARDQELDRDVVVLLLFPRWSQRPEVQQRSLEASRAVAKIFDPHVAAILGTIRLEEIFAVIRQWIPGKNLDQWLTGRDAISMEDLVFVGRGIASGLQAIHDEQVLHGDLKPANIIVRKDRLHPVITDFGTATWVSPSESPRWHGGTKGFVAPEILRGMAPSQRSDLYSLGVILRWMITGFSDREITAAEWASLRSRFLGTAPSGESLHRFENLQRVLSTLLDPDPEKLPRNANTVADWLSQCVEPGMIPIALADSPDRGLPTRRRWMSHALGLGFTAATAAWGGRQLARPGRRPNAIFIPGTPSTRHWNLFWEPVLDSASWQLVSPELVHTRHSLGLFPAIRALEPSRWHWLESLVIELGPVNYEVGLVQIILYFDTDPGRAFYRMEGRFGAPARGWVVLGEGTNLFGGPNSEAVEAELGPDMLAGSDSIQLRFGVKFTHPTRQSTDRLPIAFQVINDMAPFQGGGLHLWDRVDSQSNRERG